jgi:hypothetical protein
MPQGLPALHSIIIIIFLTARPILLFFGFPKTYLYQDFPLNLPNIAFYARFYSAV